MQRLVIVGAGGHGRETLDVVEAINSVAPTFEFLGFVADEVDGDLLERRGAACIGATDGLRRCLAELDAGFHFAIGSATSRATVDAALGVGELSARAVTLVHPLSSLGSDLRIGAGVFLAAGARVTTNVSLGRHAHVNVNAVVSHDCEIGDFVTLSPGVLVNGNVTIGDRAFLGTGAIVLPGRTIGSDAVVAAGAVVTDDVAAGVTVRGIPAR